METSSTLKPAAPVAKRDVPKMPFTCTSCRWWVPGKALSNGQAMPGQCRRNPPAPVAGGSRWAATDAGDWCGEHSGLEEKGERRKAQGDDALSRLEQQLVRELNLEHQAGTPAAGHPGDKPEAAAAPSTGGADPDGAKPADAGQPKVTKAAAFAPSPRRR